MPGATKPTLEVEQHVMYTPMQGRSRDFRGGFEFLLYLSSLEEADRPEGADI